MLDDQETLAIFRHALFDVCADFSLPFKEADHHFLTGSQLNAIEFKTVLVEGPCGAGKTHLWRTLVDTRNELNIRYRQLSFPGYNIFTRVGFGTGLRAEVVPSKLQLQALHEKHATDAKFSPLFIWQAVLAYGLGDFDKSFEQCSTWEQRVAWVYTNQSGFEQKINEIDHRFDVENVKHLCLFDALEQMCDDGIAFHWLFKGILQLAVQLNETENLRCKIFIRPDMMANIEREGFLADRLLRHKKDLYWRRCDLYNLLFTRLANHAQAGAIFRELCHSVGTHPWLENTTTGRFSPPRSLAIDEDVQGAVFKALAGWRMGDVSPNGVPYVWLINYLQDSLGFVSPHSFMAALAASVVAVDEDCPTVIDGMAIAKGIRTGWKTRNAEIDAAHPWVKLVMQPWRKQNLSLPQYIIEDLWHSNQTLSKLIENLQQEQATVQLPPKGLSSGPGGIIKELEALGIIQVLLNGKIEMNDVYRFHYRLGRQAGLRMR